MKVRLSDGSTHCGLFVMSLQFVPAPESSLMSLWRPNRSRYWTELKWHAISVTLATFENHNSINSGINLDWHNSIYSHLIFFRRGMVRKNPRLIHEYNAFIDFCYIHEKLVEANSVTAFIILNLYQKKKMTEAPEQLYCIYCKIRVPWTTRPPCYGSVFCGKIKLVSKLVFWTLQTLGIILGLKTNFNPSLSYSVCKSFSANHSISPAQLKHTQKLNISTELQYFQSTVTATNPLNVSSLKILWT